MRRQRSIARFDPKSYSDRVAADRRYTPLRHHTRTHARTHARTQPCHNYVGVAVTRGATNFILRYAECVARPTATAPRSRALTSDSS